MSFPYSSGKVAIPKLDRGLPPPPARGAPAQNREDRVTRACKNCRKRKVKCSGDVPRCAVCQTNDLICVYEQSRRDRLKEATDLNHIFVNLFKDVSARLDDEDRKRIQDVIDAAEEDILDLTSTAPSLKSLGKRNRNRSASNSPYIDSPTKKYGEAHVTASVGSNEDVDYLDEDLLRTREARQTGYVGQNSEVQWLRSVQRQSQSEHGEPPGLPYGPPGSSMHDIDERAGALHQRRQEAGTAPVRHVTDATFYLDSDNLDLDVVVNSYELPDVELAEKLLGCYMSTIHSSFPVVPQNFDAQARKFISSVRQNKAFKVPDRWRALLNLVFAIGARYSILVGYEWQGSERDHLVYMTRASQLLGMNDSVALTSGPDLALVQATAVFSLYFLVIGHVSRAWLTIGLSIRIAMSLGLHLRNEVPGVDANRKETLEKMWWSLHSIETLVSSITGRPPTISIEDTTVPVPKESSPDDQPASKRSVGNAAQMSSEASSRASSCTIPVDYLNSNLNIALLTQKALSGLYSPRIAMRSWQDIQALIRDLLQGLEDWHIRTFSGSKAPDRAHVDQIDHENMLLQMNYWSTKIIITRPCLCRTERRIRHQSDSSASFNSEMALLCVESARALTALFPQDPDPKFVYLKAPWWNVVHIIMQCAAVLLLELGYRSQYTKDPSADITSDIQKLIAWLHAMGQNDPCADRAYWVLQRILQDVAPHLRSKANELLTQGLADKDALELSSSSFESLLQQSDSEMWSENQQFDDRAPAMGHPYYLQSFGQDYQDEISPVSGYPSYDSIGLGDTRMFNTFGNPFLNTWDEHMPFSGLQNLWSNSPGRVGNITDVGSGMYTERWADMPNPYRQQESEVVPTPRRRDEARRR